MESKPEPQWGKDVAKDTWQMNAPTVPEEPVRWTVPDVTEVPFPCEDVRPDA